MFYLLCNIYLCLVSFFYWFLYPISNDFLENSFNILDNKLMKYMISKYLFTIVLSYPVITEMLMFYNHVVFPKCFLKSVQLTSWE